MKKAIGVVVAVAILSIGGVALGGLRSVANVTVDKVNRTAMGGLGSARNSTDTKEFISITVDSTPTSAPTVAITAEDSNGNFGSCQSTSQDIVTVARTIGSDGEILFNWDAQSNCTSLSVILASFTPPKKL